MPLQLTECLPCLSVLMVALFALIVLAIAEKRRQAVSNFIVSAIHMDYLDEDKKSEEE